MAASRHYHVHARETERASCDLEEFTSVADLRPREWFCFA
jgi:hypothetical protein